MIGEQLSPDTNFNPEQAATPYLNSLAFSEMGGVTSLSANGDGVALQPFEIASDATNASSESPAWGFSERDKSEIYSPDCGDAWGE